MSNVAVKGNASGTGTFTIAAPNSNNNRQFDLPDEAGTVLTNASDIEPQVKTATNATGSAPIYACRAWVNFDGTGTVSIRDSGNVSSITDNGTADYTVNFTTAMPDANYAVGYGANNVNDSTGTNASVLNAPINSSYRKSSSIRFRTMNVFNGGANYSSDTSGISISVFR